MKKRIVWIILLALWICVSVTSVSAAETYVEGDYEYMIEDGRAIITDYTGNASEVVVPAALGGCPVQRIEKYAFDELPDLRSLTISEGIEEVGDGFAYGCAALEELHIPSTLHMADCEERTVLRYYAVTTATPYPCESLKTITVAPGNENVVIHDGALYTADMTALVLVPPADGRTVLELPDTVRTIGAAACMDHRSLREVVFPDSMETICSGAFLDCAALENVELNPGLEVMERNVFCGTALKSLHIPAGVYLIETPLYTPAKHLDSPSLQTITADPDNNIYYARDNVFYLHAGNGDILIQYAQGKAETEFTVHDRVKYLEPYCFAGETDLERIILTETLEFIDGFSFAGCTALKQVRIPDSVAYIGDHAFQNCSALESAVLPAGLTEINSGIFSGCSALAEITIPAGVGSIWSGAFRDCAALSAVIFQADAPEIRDNAFEGVTADVYYPADNPTWTEEVMRDYGGTLTWIPSGGQALTGDVNGDGAVNADDAVHLLYHTLFGETYPVSGGCDFDASGSVNADDAIYLLYHTLFGGEQYPLS